MSQIQAVQNLSELEAAAAALLEQAGQCFSETEEALVALGEFGAIQILLVP